MDLPNQHEKLAAGTKEERAVSVDSSSTGSHAHKGLAATIMLFKQAEEVAPHQPVSFFAATMLIDPVFHLGDDQP